MKSKIIIAVFVANLLLPLFDKYPGLENFGWTQGQHYNDSTYEFSVNNYSDSVFINGETMDDYYEQEDNEWKEKAATDVEESLRKIVALKDEDYEVIFGDGAKVTINKNGSVEIEDYYCE